MTPLLYWIFYSHLWIPLMVVWAVLCCVIVWSDGRRQYREMIRELEDWRRRQ